MATGALQSKRIPITRQELSAKVLQQFVTASRALSAPTVGVSDWMEITQDRINKFAEEQWNLDTERAAREVPGRTTIAHELLSLSLIPTLIREIIGLKVVENMLNYGANRIRCLTPVPAGSRLRARVEVLAAQDVPPNALRVTFKVTSKSKVESAPPVSRR